MGRRWDESQRRLAKDLFGRALRVGLAGWILDRRGEWFFQQEAQDAMRRDLSESGSGVAKELSVFVEHGMLARHADGRRQYFSVVASPLWEAFAAMVIAVRQTGPPRSFPVADIGGDGGTRPDIAGMELTVPSPTSGDPASVEGSVIENPGESRESSARDAGFEWNPSDAASTTRVEDYHPLPCAPRRSADLS